MVEPRSTPHTGVFFCAHPRLRRLSTRYREASWPPLPRIRHPCSPLPFYSEPFAPGRRNTHCQGWTKATYDTRSQLSAAPTSVNFDSPNEPADNPFFL